MDLQGRLSNDIADFVRVRCQLCNNDYPLSRMKSHTRLGARVSLKKQKIILRPGDLTPTVFMYEESKTPISRL